MKNETGMTRRQAVQAALLAGPACFVGFQAVTAYAQPGKPATPATPAAPAAVAQKLVAETDPTAKALKYVEDATKATREKRGAVEGKDQFCSNCQFYVKGADVDGKAAGKCQVIPSGLVAEKGWCTTWVKKA